MFSVSRDGVHGAEASGLRLLDSAVVRCVDPGVVSTTQADDRRHRSARTIVGGVGYETLKLNGNPNMELMLVEASHAAEAADCRRVRASRVSRVEPLRLRVARPA